jgi:PAS domain S-box-containing protein
MALCFFDRDDKIIFCTDSFAALTGSSIESLIGKKLKKNMLWGGRGGKDEFQELYNRAKESGKPLIIDALRINSGKGDLRICNLSLMPQAEDDGRYGGMGLLIEDISGNALPSGSADLFHRLYTAAAQHTEAQPLLEELVCMLKDFSRCDSVKILIVDQPGHPLLKAESGGKPGLWDKDHSLSAAVINSFFVKKDDKSDSLYTQGGSLYLKDVNALEGMLSSKLKELVVNTCNSYGFNSLALIPVKWGDSISGFIQLANKNRDISGDTVATVESISEQLKIIFERIALKREIHTQRESLLKQMHGRGAHLEALSERLKQEAAERKKAQEELQIRKDLAVALTGTEKIEDALQLCLDTAISVSGMDSGGIYILDAATGSLNLACSRGLSDNFTAQISHLDASEPNTGLVLEGRSRYSPEVIKTQDEALLQAEGIKGLAIVPVMHQGKAIACLDMASHVFESVPQATRSSLEAIAVEISSTIARIRDREALAESEGRYGVLFAQSKNPVLVLDESGNYIDGNEAALSFLESSREELLRMNVRDTLPPYLDDEWLTGYRKIWETGGRVERDYYVWGKIKVMELTITPLMIGGRKAIIGIGTDITERKRLEQELRKSEEKHRSILDQMQDSCYEIDLEGKYTYVNDAMCRGLWYTREELIGKRYRLLVPEEDLDTVYQAFYKVYETGMPNIGFAHKIRRKDGAVGIAESSITLLKNERGEPVGFLCIGRDITQRISLEAALKQAEEKYSTILEEIDEAYVECDSKGSLTFVNDAACRQLGYRREELIGMNYKIFSSPDDVHERLGIFTKVFQTGEPVYWWPTQMIRKDGTRIDVENSIFPLRNKKNEITGLRVVRRNVTEQKRMESALREREDKYRTILEEINDSYVEDDLKGNKVFFNDAACRNLGYSREEFAGMNYSVYTTPDKIEEVFKVYSEVIRTGIPVYWHPFVYMHKNGTQSFVESSVFPRRNEKGEIVGTRTINRNVTEKKLAAQELEKRALMLDSSYDSIIAFDPEGNITYVNERAYKTRGYERDELLTMDIRQLVAPERIPILEERLAAILERGELEFQTEHVRKDGSTFPVEGRSRLISVSGQQVIVSGYTDITLRKKAEEALVESEALYRLLSEHTADGVLLLDMNLKITYVSPSVEKIRGFTPLEAIKMPLEKHITPESLKLASELFLKELPRVEADPNYNPVPILELEYYCKDGTTIWTESKFSVIRDPSGRPVSILGEVWDITERKQAEGLLVRERNFSNAIIEGLPGLFYMTGMDGKFIRWNQNDLQVTGYTDEDVPNLNALDIISPEDRKLASDKMLEAFNIGATDAEIDILTKTGEKIPYHITGKRFSMGEKTYLLGMGIDITDRKKAEMALVESESKYRSLVESGGASIAIIDMEGKLAFANDTLCRMAGYSKGELLGKTFMDFVHPEDRDRDAQLFLEAVDENKTGLHLETRVLHKDGHIIWLYTSPVELKINDKLVGFSVILQDITERKEAEDKIERLNLVLQAISLVNQLIVREKDPDQLLQLACDSLVNTRGFKSAGIVLLDESGNFVTLTQAGSLDGLSEYMEGLIQGNIPYCIKSALERSGPVEIADKISQCVDCPLWTADQDHPVVSARLWYEEKVYGVLTVSVPENITLDKEEMELIGEVAGDIAFALHNIELEKEKKKTDDALHESEEHFRSLAEESPDMIFIHDMRRIVYANKLCEEVIGYSREELYAESFDFMKLIAPEHRDRLRESFAAHAEGKEVPQVEYALVTSSGSRIDALINTRLIMYSQKPAILGVVTDVTQMRRVERALFESENKYRVILEEANEAYLEIDAKGNFAFVNDAACRHLGYSREELVGLNYKAITLPAEVHSRVEIWADVFRTGTPRHRVEYRNIRKDGTIYYAECSIFPLHDKEGQIVGLRTVAQDITRRKEAEDALRRSEEKYRTIMEEMDESYVEVDLMGNITFANDAVTRNLGYSKEEFMGINYKVYTPQDQIKEKARIYSEVVRTGTPVYWQPFSNIRKDGTLLFSEVCIFPIRNEKGEITGLRTVTQDVTETKLAAHELQKRALLLDSAYDSIIAYDNVGNIIYVNERACQTHGYEPAEMQNMHGVDLRADEDVAAWDSRIIALLEKGYLEFEAIHKRKDGSSFPVSGRARVADIAGQPMIVVAYTDITVRKKMEKALVESESKYRSLVESGGAGIATTDTSGRVEFVNDTLCRMMGYSKQELQGRDFNDFIYPEDREKLLYIYQTEMQTAGKSLHMEFRAVHKDGHILWMYTSPAELLYENQAVGFSAIIQDVTERKRAEETVRQNEEKYGPILEEIDEHYAEIDAKGNFTFVNEAMCRYFGYSREEMIGMNYKTYTPPENLKQRLEVFSEVFKTGKPTYWQLFDDIVKDGSRRLVEISIFPLKDYKGEILGLRTIGRDVTDRKQAEANLRESEERYRLLAENSLDVIFTTDMNTQLTYISPSVRYLTGLSAEEILTMLRQNKLSAESLGISLRDGHRFQQSLKALTEDPSRTEVFEFALKHRDGYINWAEVQMSIMREKFGQAAGILGVVRDISQQKKMTERLVSADRLASLGEMAAGLAHEVNNPLTAVMGFSYLLLQNTDTPADVRNDVEAIYNEGKRAAEIIRNFLTFARGQKPEKQAVYVNDILEEVLKLRHNQMENENIQVNLSLWEDLPAIQGDISQLQQVFLNIILNAEYFMYRTNRRGNLTVNTQLVHGKIVVVIADDGPGIAPEAISRIFDPFYTTKEVGEGTGLGLSICHGIVMGHGGTILAESVQGQGATLTVELPVR